MAGEGVPSLFPLGDLAIIGFAAIASQPAENPRPHRRNRARGRCRQARCAGHHRQSGIHPSRRAQGARPRARNPDRRLCLPVGLGVAAGPRARHARLCRSCAGAAAVRTGGDATAGRPALHVRRPSAERAGRRLAAECRGGAPAPVRSAAAAGAAGQPRRRNPPHGGGVRRGGGAAGRARRRARGGGAGGAAAWPRRCARRSRPGACRRAS